MTNLSASTWPTCSPSTCWQAFEMIEAWLSAGGFLRDRTSIPTSQLVQLIEMHTLSFRTASTSNQMEQLWDTPLTSGSQCLHRTLRRDRPADSCSPPNPQALAQIHGRHFCCLATWTGWARMLPWTSQHTVQQHKVHRCAWEWEQDGILDAQVTQSNTRLSTGVYCKLTHTDCYIYPFPLPPPSEDHHRSTQMYVGQG